MTDPGAAVPLQLELRAIRSVHEVPAADWDAVTRADPDGTPFHRHAFLAAFEDTGCTGAGTGWRPLHVTVWTASGALVGVAPAFVKSHSMGEFVYDFAWAEAATRAGLRYYPKLVVAAPFSPVTGRRLFARAAPDGPPPERVREVLLDGLVAVASEAGLSGIHLLFALEDELEMARQRGFAVRRGCQFHWRNDGYADFEAFLARFPSKRRNQIRRERRQVRESGVRIQHLHGEAIDEVLQGPAFAFYAATVDRYVYGRRYLNEAFFARLFTDLREHLQLTLAWRGGEIVGGALNLEHGERRFGRYWGALEEVAALHFEVCAYAGIEDAIARGIATFEAGAGGEAHKLKRGFLPARTGSAHLVLQPDFQAAVEDFCGREAMALEAAMTEMADDVFAHP
jgi:predicted N-acyltransferase